MLGYNFEIIYKKGKQNVVADGLSREDEDVEELFFVISIIQPDSINEVRDEWKNYEEVWPLIQKLEKIPVQIIFPEFGKEGKIILEPEAVTETRNRQLRNQSISDYLIGDSTMPITD